MLWNDQGVHRAAVLVGGLLAAFALLGDDSLQRAHADPEGRVPGHVQVWDNDTVVVGAQVQLVLLISDAAPTVKAQGETNADGIFEYMAVPGRYVIRVRKPGYKDATAALQLVRSSDEIKYTRVEMQRGGDTPGPEIQVSVFVQDERGTPIRTEQVAARGNGREYAPVAQGRDGEHRFALPPGAYEVRARAAGYQDGGTEFSLRAGLHPGPVTIRLQRENQQMPVVLLAVDPLGNPMPGATMAIFRRDARGQEELLGRKRTDRRGRLRFDTAPGPYRAALEVDDTVVGEARFVVTPQERPEPLLVRVAMQQPPEPAMAQVVLRIVDAGRRPIASAEVVVYVELPNESKQVGTQRTDGSGTARFDLEPGASYVAMVRKRGYASAHDRFDVRSPGASVVKTIVVEREQPPARLVLRVVDEDSKPVQASVEVRDLAGQPQTAEAIGGRGRHVFKLPPGEYRVFVTRKGFEPLQQIVRAVSGPAQPVVLTMKRTVTSATVVIKVRSTSGGFVGGAQVDVFRLGGAARNRVSDGLTNRGGEFTAVLPAGTYGAVVGKDGYESEEVAPFTVRSGAATATQVVALTKTSQTRLVVVSVFDTEDRPMAASVVVRNGAGVLFRSTERTEPNRYHYTLMPGVYEVSATQDGYGPARATLDVAPGSAELRTSLRLPRNLTPVIPDPVVPDAADAWLIVRVIDENEAPLDGAIVTIKRANESPQDHLANAKGQVRLRVRPGAYAIDAKKTGFRADREAVQVAEDGATVDLVLIKLPDPVVPPEPVDPEPVAPPEPVEPPVEEAPLDDEFDAIFRRLDIDKNDVLDAADFSEQGWVDFKAVFRAKGDQPLARTEFAAVVRRVLPKRPPVVSKGPISARTPAENARIAFDALDTNNDGLVGPDDFTGDGWADVRAALGHDADTPLTLAMFTTQLVSAKQAPAKRDVGAASAAPARSPSARAQAMHRKLDRNHDGVVDASDFTEEGWRDMQARKIDEDGNGSVSVQELQKLTK